MNSAVAAPRTHFHYIVSDTHLHYIASYTHLHYIASDTHLHYIVPDTHLHHYIASDTHLHYIVSDTIKRARPSAFARQDLLLRCFRTLLLLSYSVAAAPPPRARLHLRARPCAPVSPGNLLRQHTLYTLPWMKDCLPEPEGSRCVCVCVCVYCKHYTVCCKHIRCVVVSAHSVRCIHLQCVL